MVCGFTPERRASRNLAPSINEFLIPIIDESYTEHQRGPMSFQANCCFAAETPGYALAIPVFATSRENMSNILTYHAIKPRGGPKKGKSGTILQIPC
jgi:hypothetical protein